MSKEEYEKYKPAYRLSVQMILYDRSNNKIGRAKSMSFYNTVPFDLEKLETALIEAFEKVKI